MTSVSLEHTIDKRYHHREVDEDKLGYVLRDEWGGYQMFIGIILLYSSLTLVF